MGEMYMRMCRFEETLAEMWVWSRKDLEDLGERNQGQLAWELIWKEPS